MLTVDDNVWIAQIRDWISSPLGILAMACLLVYIGYVHSRREHPTYDDDDYEKEAQEIPAPLQNLKLTVKELKAYDARNPNGSYLVAFQDKIYDVSCAPQDFGPNGSYHELTGTDIMWYVEKTAQYESRGFDAHVEECEKRLEDRFFVAGELVTNKKEGPSCTDSDSSWNTVEESTTDTEPDELKVKVEKSGNEKQALEKVGDTEDKLNPAKAEGTIIQIKVEEKVTEEKVETAKTVAAEISIQIKLDQEKTVADAKEALTETNVETTDYDTLLAS